MKHYHKNPRQITEKQFSQLQSWLEEFGDLSGIVHNVKTDEIIGGNQRAEAMHFMNGTKPTIEHTYRKPTRTGTVAEGYFTYKGERINYRRVDWTAKKSEKATIIAAQNLSRRCFAMEISPAYCAVILQRFADAFPDEEIELIK